MAKSLETVGETHFDISFQPASAEMNHKYVGMSRQVIDFLAFVSKNWPD
jgi:hypothetical protein